MRVYDSNGTTIVCTCTKQEREALDDLPPVHFVASERYASVDD